MNSHLSLDAILPNLEPAQIDELRCENQYLKNYIGRIRQDLPTTQFEQLGVWSENDTVTLFGVLNNETHEKVVEGDRLMDYLDGISPKEFALNNVNVIHQLDPKWLAKCKNVKLDYHQTKEHLDDLFQKLSPTSFSIKCNDGCEMLSEDDADEILRRMEHVSELKLIGVPLSPMFMEYLVQKTKNGPGLKSFTHRNPTGPPIDANDVIHLIKNAKFMECTDPTNISHHVLLHFYQIAGSRWEFMEKLNRIPDKKLDRKLNKADPNYITISSSDCIIDVLIGHFEADFV